VVGYNKIRIRDELGTIIPMTEERQMMEKQKRTRLFIPGFEGFLVHRRSVSSGSHWFTRFLDSTNDFANRNGRCRTRP
jgi:hypothetical protein